MVAGTDQSSSFRQSSLYNMIINDCYVWCACQQWACASLHTPLSKILNPWVEKPQNVSVSLLSKWTLKHVNFFSTRCVQVCLDWVESQWIWPKRCSPEPHSVICTERRSLSHCSLKPQLKLQHAASILVVTDEPEPEFSQTIVEPLVGLETEKQRAELTEAGGVPQQPLHRSGMCTGY